ncbi:thermonuclease family protein [Reyranella sp.]|uniref:thermonuclease family protein n=1 Tax=Reyranella sp. TaxID=1929291 RepID=UPI003D0D7A6B
MKLTRCLLTALVLLCASPLAAQGNACRDRPVPPLVEGRASAVDGDTLAIAGHPRLRLWGIQAPELRDRRSGVETGPGMQARAGLADRLARGGDDPVHCRPSKWDHWCRLVATCEAASGNGPDGRPVYEDLSAGLLRDGMAYTFMLDDTEGRRAEDSGRADEYSRAESAARKGRIGLWPIWMGR